MRCSASRIITDQTAPSSVAPRMTPQDTSLVTRTVTWCVCRGSPTKEGVKEAGAPCVTQQSSLVQQKVIMLFKDHSIAHDF